MAFLTIPGNIKQASLPYQLDKSVTFQGADSSYSSKNVNLFTFKPNVAKAKVVDGKTALIQPFPKSLSQYVNEDISFKHLYDRESQKIGSGRITYANFLEQIPCIQIREYLPDSKIDQIFNFFNGFLSGFKTANAEEVSGVGGDEQSTVSNLIKNVCGGIGQIGRTIMNTLEEMWNVFKDTSNSKIADVVKQYSGDLLLGMNSPERYYTMSFPYMMYYHMMGTTTTNIYELPFNPQELYKTQGSEGWKSDKFNFGMDQAKSMIGSVISKINSNVGIHISPTWSGNAEGVDDVTIQFQLFNDSFEKTINNFIFVNTIVPNNMWCQYHIFRHCSDLYDIKIQGVKRMMMCSADITVTPKGVLRTLPQEFVDKITDTYLQDDWYHVNSDVMRVPDVYDISIKFTSLLPNNFNNFLFNYALDRKVYETVGFTKLGHEDSAFTNFSTALGDDLETVEKNIKQKKIKQAQEQKEMDKIAEGLKKLNTVSLLDDGTKSKWDNLADETPSPFQTESSMFPISGGSSMFSVK